MILLVTTMLGAGGAGWFKIQAQALENENQRITIELSAEQATVASQREEIDLIATQVDQFSKKIAQIEAERLSARRQVEYTRTLFNDHDLAKLMAAKPGLITNRMQKASDAVLTDLQSVTE